eukprot:5951473-Karenia_brevis.AAC.1
MRWAIFQGGMAHNMMASQASVQHVGSWTENSETAMGLLMAQQGHAWEAIQAITAMADGEVAS